MTDEPQCGLLASIPSGQFLMGASNHSQGFDIPVHSVRVSSFLMDAYPITNLHFLEFIEACPSWGREAGIKIHRNIYYLFDWRHNRPPKGKELHPVVWVNWISAATFCNWRSRAESLEECYDESTYECDFDAKGYRLPTEAEYEWSMRGGLESSPYPWGVKLDSSITNYDHQIGGTSKVGSFQPNAFGLYDMAGNVKQWCNDWFDESYYGKSPQADPSGPDFGEFRVFRGGSWGSPPNDLLCHTRGWLLPPNTNPDLGFRCVRRVGI